MVPVDVRRQPHLSFSQLDQYLRCPLKYRFQYIDRVEPEFVPAAQAFGSGIHAAAAFLYREVGKGRQPAVADVQGYFETFWALEAKHQPLRYGEKETPESLLDLGRRMLAVVCANVEEGVEVLAVEQPFKVPLIDPETGEVLDRDLVGSLDRLERDREGHLVVVDLKTAARRYSDLQVEASLQLSIYSYATAMTGRADQDAVRLRFDVVTKTKQPELHRYWTTRDRAANARLFRLASEVLLAIEVGAFHPVVGWQCKECPFRSRCWAWK